MQIRIFGINNCDKVRRSRAWLNDHDVEHVYHDYYSDGINKQRLKAHLEKFGWENVVNKKGTTWRNIPDDVKEKVVDNSTAFDLLCNYPTTIKRPIIEFGNNILVGFDEDIWLAHLIMKSDSLESFSLPGTKSVDIF